MTQPASGSYYTDPILEFILETPWSDLPDSVRLQSKRCLLDTLGALLAGTRTPVADIMTRTARTQFPGDQATILGSGFTASAAGAALANGFAGNALDIDDGYRLVKGHPGACVLPPILAATELVGGVSGESFLTALVVGYELGIRAGMIRHARYPTYHASGSWGAISGAGAAGKILGLGRDTLIHALGTAEYHAPLAPMMKGIDTPSMAKDSIGWGCMTAVLSVLMARKGFTGIIPLFEETPDPEWILGLGNRYEIMNLYFKPYAACRWAQPAVDGALKILRDHRIGPDAVEAIQVRTFDAASRLSRRYPRNTEEAQYNMAFPIAAALIDGEVGPAQVLPPRLFDRDIQNLMDRVSAVPLDAFEAAFPAKALAEVVITTIDGASLTSGVMAAGWEPPDTLPSDAELTAKFERLVAPVLGPDRAQTLAAAVAGCDMLEDARDLIPLCCEGFG